MHICEWLTLLGNRNRVYCGELTRASGKKKEKKNPEHF